jgi:YesN/AraC family two-component response regulator
MLNELLTGEEFEVREASDGRQAIKLYTEQSTDIVITDLVMPGKEGLEMIVEMKRLHAGAKIIAISGGGRNSSQNYLKMAKAFGAQIVLAKPFSHREILEAITQVLEH